MRMTLFVEIIVILAKNRELRKENEELRKENEILLSTVNRLQASNQSYQVEFIKIEKLEKELSYGK